MRCVDRFRAGAEGITGTEGKDQQEHQESFHETSARPVSVHAPSRQARVVAMPMRVYGPIRPRESPSRPEPLYVSGLLAGVTRVRRPNAARRDVLQLRDQPRPVGDGASRRGTDPATGRKLAPQLPVARHTTDVLGVLADKTKGNLDDEEQKLIDSVLFECRSKFVAASQASEAAPQRSAAYASELQTTNRRRRRCSDQ